MPLRKIRYRREPVAEINMTNLIDIIMVLLIVFILVSNFVTTGLNIEIPKVRYTQTVGKEKIIIALSGNGDIALNGEKIALEDLPPRLAALKEQYPEQSVFIHSDAMAVVQDFSSILSIATETGFKSVSFAANQETEPRG